MPQPPADEGTITELRRLSNSINGNPRYLIKLDNGNEYITKSDGSIGYELQNYNFEGCTVRLLLVRVNRAFRVWDISVV